MNFQELAIRAFLYLTRLGRSVTVAVLAGGIAGVLVGGLGGRLAMRISAIAAGPSAQGMLTENGNMVGDITLEGTIGLVIFGALFGVIIGGLLYMAVRRWLPDRGKGISFGLFFLVLFGSVIVNSDNSDFLRLEPRLLNILLFASLFPIFGLVVAPLAERFHTALPPAPSRVTTQGNAVMYFLLAPLSLFPILLAIVEGEESPLLSVAAVLVYTIALFPTTALTSVAAYMILAVGIVVGLVYDMKAVSEILGFPLAL